MVTSACVISRPDGEVTWNLHLLEPWYVEPFETTLPRSFSYKSAVSRMQIVCTCPCSDIPRKLQKGRETSTASEGSTAALHLLRGRKTSWEAWRDSQCDSKCMYKLGYTTQPVAHALTPHPLKSVFQGSWRCTCTSQQNLQRFKTHSRELNILQPFGQYICLQTPLKNLVLLGSTGQDFKMLATYSWAAMGCLLRREVLVDCLIGFTGNGARHFISLWWTLNANAILTYCSGPVVHPCFLFWKDCWATLAIISRNTRFSASTIVKYTYVHTYIHTHTHLGPFLWKHPIPE